jgi:hypothetical protein
MYSSAEALIAVGFEQGDQIGRIFAQSEIVFFGQVVENCRICPNVWATILHGKFYVLILTKMGWDPSCVIFFTNSTLEPILQFLNLQLQRQRCSRLERF